MTYWDSRDPEQCDNADEHFVATIVESLGLCGYGRPGAIISEMVAILKRIDAKADPEVSEHFGELGTELLLHIMDNAELTDHGSGTELLLHIMDNAELTDHGSSLFYGWLTDKGRRFLAILDGKDPDDFDGGFACSICPEKDPDDLDELDEFAAEFGVTEERI